MGREKRRKRWCKLNTKQNVSEKNEFPEMDKKNYLVWVCGKNASG